MRDLDASQVDNGRPPSVGSLSVRTHGSGIEAAGVRQSRLLTKKKSLSKRDFSEMLNADSPSIKRKYSRIRLALCGCTSYLFPLQAKQWSGRRLDKPGNFTSCSAEVRLTALKQKSCSPH